MIFKDVHAQPLSWPVGWKRSGVRKKSKFATTFARAWRLRISIYRSN